MAVEDHSTWLPKSPPPRPARRDAAIEAALRKFDGVDDPAPAASERPRMTYARRPQVAVLASVLLVLVVGIPAALIGLRDEQPASGGAPSPPLAQHAPAPGAEAAETPPAETVAGPLAAREEAIGEARIATRNEAAPPAARVAESAPPLGSPVVAAAPPPAAAAPAAALEPLAVASAENPRAPQPGEEVVVTGSRIARPALDSASPVNVIGQEQAYRAFLSHLQAAVRANNRRAVIGVIAFPLRVNATGGTRLYRDARSVEEHFERIFTRNVRRAILNQSPERITVRGRAATIGNGQVRYAPACGNSACAADDPMRIVAVTP